MHGKRETTPRRKKQGFENDPGYRQRQREVEASCKNLIVDEHLTEGTKIRRKEVDSELGLNCAKVLILVKVLKT